MKIIIYKGFHGVLSKCGLRIFENQKRAVVVLIELPDNLGTSITNFYEDLATTIYHRKLKPKNIDIENITWVEHYIEGSIEYSLVELKYNKADRRFLEPEWKFLSKKRFQEIIDDIKEVPEIYT
ncbi:MAG: hypothetical protein GF317_09745 [Candidatus Lokiarchaeota archaeon]|nr:hypothetical protein [Candidatus Lokiarchaeota archaeon]